MSKTIGTTMRNLNDCGCCEGITVETPVEITNRPGLTAIAYRVGTHTQFKQSMLAHLSSSQLQALWGLTTRANYDFTIALLDAWATVADVLTFYQERIANESYLRTATERVSILYLARLIGYELRPGVAASDYLAFTLEDAPSAPHKATIDIGTKVQSIPGHGEQPQTFETIEKIEAQAEWNVIKPRLTRRHPVREDTDSFFFEGVSTGLKPGDGLLIIPDDGKYPVFRQVEEVTPQREQQSTLVKLQPLPSNTASSASTRASAVERVLNPSPITSIYLNKIISAANLDAEAQIRSFSVRNIFDNIVATQPPPPTVFAFRTKASILGHNAPAFESLPYNMTEEQLIYKNNGSVTQEVIPGPFKKDKGFWADQHLDIFSSHYKDSNNDIFLDNVYSNIVKDSITKESYVVLKDADADKLGIYKIAATTELSKSVFTITSRVTRLTLDSHENFEKFGIQTTTVFAQNEELPLACMPIEESVSGMQIELDGLLDDGLSAGQTIIICGELEQNRGVRGCEVATIAQVEQVLESDSFTRITLTTRLNNDYVRETVTINANIARATHGETVQEVLGSGDATQPYQRFTLRQPPLTYISAPTPSGAESTLLVRINDLLWHEVPTLYGCGPSDRVFVTRTGDDGKTTVQFGDGQTGMRLPTGQENVRATYRKGIGLAGNLDVGQLSLLMTRPLGVKSVTNPLSANGAADRESLDDARHNAPLTLLTMDRIVSLQDYEDFARAFAGIAKALATWTWDGQIRSVFVTVAGPNGAEINPDSDLYKNLLSAMQKAGDPYVPIRVESYRRALFRIAVRVKVNPDYRSEQVLAAVEHSLRSHFSFDARDFGQSVMMSEVMAVIQAVPGVKATDVDRLYRYGEKAKLNPGLAAAAPQAGTSGAVSAGELLTLDPATLDDLGVML